MLYVHQPLCSQQSRVSTSVLHQLLTSVVEFVHVLRSQSVLFILCDLKNVTIVFLFMSQLI